MEEDSILKPTGNSEKSQYSSKEKKLKKRGKTKSNQFKNFFQANAHKIKNKIIKGIIKKEDNSKEIKKVRNPGVDLVRIISMYTIVLNHVIFFGRGYNHFPKYIRPLSLVHSITDWNTNGFILISGIVGYKTNKYSNLFYLWLTVLFYSVGIHKYVEYFKKGYIVNEEMYKEYYPIIFKRYWYFSTYFGMYLFLPVINKGIASLTKFEHKLVVISTIGILILWRDYKNPGEDLFLMHVGDSILWFIIFYLTGAYIGKYRVDYFGLKKYIYCFICMFIYSLASYLYFKSYHKELDLPISLRRMFNKRLNSILKISQTITATLFLMQIHYNKYIAKFICFIGPLVFGIYLIHNHSFIHINVINHVFDNQPKDLNLNGVLTLVFGKTLKICIICLIIDYLRNLLFTLLRIKKISIFLETKLMEKFNN